VTAQAVQAAVHRVLDVRDLSPSAYALRLSRGSLAFQPGQWINVGLAGERERREYTVYSAPEDPFLEILVKEIPGGAVSPALRASSPGDLVAVDGPHGAFLVPERHVADGRFLFLATGTGISPFHCFAARWARLDYLLVHGVRTRSELYEHAAFDAARLVARVSREDGPCRGRVTDWLRETPTGPWDFFYLCGNSDMIYEAFAILRARGITRTRIFTEVYF
jgi:ferredoxin--NADP+ reductase/benzoate/toluate 1,2-dioxygenase reductase subunit